MSEIQQCYYEMAHGNLTAELERLRVQVHMTWSKEVRHLQWLGLRDGMSVVELGSGPGFVTEQLLALLPSSTITAVDREAELMSHARRHLETRAGERVDFVQADAAATGLPAGSFDFAYARYLVQHVPDPPGVIGEAHRLLKPGGKLAILDVDDELTGIAQPQVPGLDRLMATVARAQAARGGDRHLGRKLWPMLEAGGFRALQLDAIITQSHELGLGPFQVQTDIGRLLPLVQAGWVSQEELGRLAAVRAAFFTDPQAYTLGIVLMASGAKPSPVEVRDGSD